MNINKKNGDSSTQLSNYIDHTLSLPVKLSDYSKQNADLSNVYKRYLIETRNTWKNKEHLYQIQKKNTITSHRFRNKSDRRK